MWPAHMITASAPSPAEQARSSRSVPARARMCGEESARGDRIAPRPRARARAGLAAAGGAILPAGLMARLSPFDLLARELPAPPSRRGEHCLAVERCAPAWLAHLEEECLEAARGEYHHALAGLGSDVGAAVHNARGDVQGVSRAERYAPSVDLHLKAPGQHVNGLRLIRVPVRRQAPPGRRLVDEKAEPPTRVGRAEL